MNGASTVYNVSINDIARVIFLQNSGDAKIVLDIDGLENTKDIFCFCLDLLCKGMVLVYGKDDKVSISDLSIEQFQYLSKRMELAGFKVLLNIQPMGTDDVEAEAGTEAGSDEHKKAKTFNKMVVSIAGVKSMDDNLDIKDYKFELLVEDMLYTIRFDIVRLI